MKDEIEIWRYIPQYDGFLQASTFGNIREYIQIIKSDGLPHVLRNRPINISSRGIIRYKGPEQSVNRLIFSAFYHIPPTLHRVLHKDGNSNNKRPDNLYCENIAAKGEQNYQAKLNSQQIYNLCYDFINGHNAKVLSEKYNIHFMNVYRVLRNNIWQSVTRPTITRQILKTDKKKILKAIEEKLNSKQS